MFSATPPPRLLIVEDDAAIASILALLFNMLGCETQVAADGALGLAALAAGPLPDALLLDIRLPSCGPDGLTLARMVRARPAWDALAIVLMTAEAYDEDHALTHTGADAFVRKPVPDGETLLALITQCVARRRTGVRL